MAARDELLVYSLGKRVSDKSGDTDYLYVQRMKRPDDDAFLEFTKLPRRSVLVTATKTVPMKDGTLRRDK